MCHYSSKKLLPYHPCYGGNNGTNLSQEQISETLVGQNLFSVGVIILCLCYSCEPLELGLVARTNYNFDCIREKKDGMKDKYPKTHFHLEQMLKKTFPKFIKYENFIVSEEALDKENSYCIRDFKVLPIKKIEKGESKKKLKTLKFPATLR